MQGINHNHRWGDPAASDGIPDALVAGCGVQVAAVLGQVHIKTACAVVLLPRRYAPAKAVVALTGQIDDRARPDLTTVPAGLFGGGRRYAQAHIQHYERLAAARGTVNHHQRALLQPVFNQPTYWRWFLAEGISSNQPAVGLWSEQSG